MEKFIQESLRLGITPTFLSMIYGQENLVKNEFGDYEKKFCPGNYERFSLAAREEVVRETAAAIDNWDDCLNALKKQRYEQSMPEGTYMATVKSPSYSLFKEFVLLTDNMLISGNISDLQELRLWMRVGVNRNMIMYCVNRSLHYLCCYGNVHMFHYVLENFPVRFHQGEKDSYLRRVEQRKDCFSSKDAYDKCRQIISIRGIGNLV